MNITINNYEEHLIDYLHGELIGDAKVEMEAFLQQHPAIQEEFELLKDTIVTPDKSIVFDNKEAILKKEKPVGLWVSYKKQFAMAASVIGILFAIYMMNNTSNEDVIAKIPQTKVEVPITKVEDSSVQLITKVDTTVQHKIPITPSNSIVKKERITTHQSSAIYHQPNNKIEKMIKQKEELTAPVVVQKEEIHTQQIETIIPKHEAIVKEEKPIVIENKKPEVELVANNLTPKGTVEFNTKKQPRLFKLINGIVHLTNKAKQTKEAITNTTVTVMVGNKKIINFNHF